MCGGDSHTGPLQEAGRINGFPAACFQSQTSPGTAALAGVYCMYFFSSSACYSVLCLPPATHTGAGWHRMRQFILATGYSSGSTSDFNGLLGNLLHLAEWLFFSCIIACPNCCGCCLTVAMCMCVCVAALCLFGPFSKLPVWRPEPRTTFARLLAVDSINAIGPAGGGFLPVSHAPVQLNHCIVASIGFTQRSTFEISLPWAIQ